MNATTLEECCKHGASIVLCGQIDMTKPVKVYRNIRQKVYSIMQHGVVVAHATKLAMRDCEFLVNEKGRQRVIASKRKNVHAFISGYLTPSGMGTDPSDSITQRKMPVKITYNPYTAGSFIENDKTPITHAKFIILDETGAYTS